jgi:hypothetical protein
VKEWADSGMATSWSRSIPFKTSVHNYDLPEKKGTWRLAGGYNFILAS